MMTRFKSAQLGLNFSFAEILAMLLIGGQIAIYVFMWFQLLGNPSLKTMDFVSFYAVGRLIRAGEYGQIYDFESEAVLQRSIVGESYGDPLVFNHPPHVTPLLALIASDDYVRAYIYWSAVRLLVALICMELIRRFLARSGFGRFHAILGALGGITFFPIFIGLLGGQDTLFTLLGLLIWMFALIKRDEISAGFGLAFATLSPPIAGALALPLLASRRRAGIWFIVGSLGLAVYSFLLVGVQGIRDLAGLLFVSSQGSYYGFNWFAMYNLLGTLVRAFPNVSMDAIRSIVWIATFLSILVMCVYWWAKRGGLDVKHIGITTVAGIFTAPHLHFHGLSFLLLPLISMITMLHFRGNKSTALVLIPVISSIQVIILFLLPDLSYASAFLLMLAMLIGLIVLKPSATQ